MTSQKRFTPQPVVQYQAPAPQPAPSFVPSQPQPRHDPMEVTYGVSQWNPPPWFAPPQGPAEMECDYCGDHISPGQTAVELFCGVVGRSWKTGHAMVVTDVKAQDLAPVILHLECIELYSRHEIFGGYDPEDEEPVFCASCANRIEEDYEDEG